MSKKTSIFIFLLIVFSQILLSQSKEAARYEIDVKRYDLDYKSREALLRSREFIRLDSTYYVGYLYEGSYKYDRASDYLGYKNCIPPLKKAINLLEKDFGEKLSARYNSWNEYSKLRIVQTDYRMLVYELMESYSNLEYPDSVIMLLNRYKKWDMQHDELGADNYIAWTIHRNRFYTSKKYGFLKNSIKENDEVAFDYLYKSLAKINANAKLNEKIFPPIYIEADRLGVYHYLALMHDYEQNMDSAMYYFRKMEMYTIFPYNNFAIFCFVNGDFMNADTYFKISREQEHGDKRLRESEYYALLIEVLKGNPVEGIKKMSEFIRENGISAGWGWYNIALARGYLYNGQLDKAEQHLKKAKNFRELHIGTTWGQSHYDITIKFLQTFIDKQKIQAQKFENKRYWMSLKSMSEIAKAKAEFWADQFILLNQLALNPERETVFFRVFASECTVSFDEILQSLISAFDNNYFVKLYIKFLDDDKRIYIKKYIRFFLANIYAETKNRKDALYQLDKIKEIEYIDDEYEVLFEARIYELYAKLAKTKEMREKNILKLYETYPQLVPYSGLKMGFRIDVYSDGTNKTEDEVLNKLQQYNISIKGKNEEQYPKAKITFKNDGETNFVEFEVVSPSGKIIVPKTKAPYSNSDFAAKKLAYGFFNMIEPILTTNPITVPTKNNNYHIK